MAVKFAGAGGEPAVEVTSPAVPPLDVTPVSDRLRASLFDTMKSLLKEQALGLLGEGRTRGLDPEHLRRTLDLMAAQLLRDPPLTLDPAERQQVIDSVLAALRPRLVEWVDALCQDLGPIPSGDEAQRLAQEV